MFGPPPAPPLVVLEDDPTGTQAVRGVRALLQIDAARVRELIAAHAPAVHLLTNARARSASEAEAITAQAAAAAPAGTRVVLRGDSTLRGHMWEEYRAVSRSVHPGCDPVLLLVPALPAAGRITVDGVHMMTGPAGERIALHDTEFAHDGAFAYRSSRLLEWAEERSGGALRPELGREIPLAELRASGAAAVAAALAEVAAANAPGVCAPDAESIADLELIAAGVASAELAGTPLVIRCAPALVGVMSNTLAEDYAATPRAGAGGVLVVCGSYVSPSTRQLQHLGESLEIPVLEPDVSSLCSDDPGHEARRVAALAGAQLTDRGVAVVATPRERDPRRRDLRSGERIARGLGLIVAELRPRPDVIVAKGGITSQVVAEVGLGAAEAEVMGPVVAGVALWRLGDGERKIDYLVFPGNVGGYEHLTELVRRVLESRC